MKEIFINSVDEYKLCLHVFKHEKATAVVQIVHGMEEHQERYEKLAKILNEAGLSVVSSDMRGHGKDVDKNELGFFKKKNGYFYLVEDQKVITNYIKKEFPNLPVYIFAHSMGTIITRVLLQENSEKYQKVVLSGYPNYQKGAELGVFIADTVKLFHGAKYKSKIIEKLGVGAFNTKIKNPKTKVDWVCANEKALQQYIDDPLCGIGFTCSAFSDLFNLVKLMHQVKLYKNVNKNLKFLFLRGIDDPCTGGEDGAKDSREVLKQAGFGKIKYIDYPGMRHEIINEKENQKVFSDIVKFFCEREKDGNVKITQKFKQKYFDSYDDVKSHTHNVYDW